MKEPTNPEVINERAEMMGYPSHVLGRGVHPIHTSRRYAAAPQAERKQNWLKSQSATPKKTKGGLGPNGEPGLTIL